MYVLLFKFFPHLTNNTITKKNFLNKLKFEVKFKCIIKLIFLQNTVVFFKTSMFNIKTRKKLNYLLIFAITIHMSDLTT